MPCHRRQPVRPARVGRRRCARKDSAPVVGIPLAEARVLGLSYELNAIMFMRQGAPPELVLLAPLGRS